jgi:Ca2+-binding RTX toxin-like protein
MNKYFVVLVVLALLLAGVGAQTQPVFADDCVNGAALFGNNLPNVINGGPANNLIRGGGGDDTLRGWGCNDVIYGGAGNDYIDGGPGFDKCYGGPGVDVFVNCEVVVQ